MAMYTGAAKASWHGVLIAVGAIAVVSVVAVVRDWDFGSWLLAAYVCLVTAAVSAVSRARRNRKLDRAAGQARSAAFRPSAR